MQEIIKLEQEVKMKIAILEKKAREYNGKRK